MADRYGSFEELQRAEIEDRDWARRYEPRGSRVLVMAPHGGWIEPYTTELASSVAGDTFSFYTFQGLSPGARRLHITSHRFDEPLALEAVADAEVVVAIHGERTSDAAFVMVGGREMALGDSLSAALERQGFRVVPPRGGLRGQNPRNICNRGNDGGGVQLELSQGLRNRFQDEPHAEGRFVEAVRRVLLRWEEEGRVTPQNRDGIHG